MLAGEPPGASLGQRLRETIRRGERAGVLVEQRVVFADATGGAARVVVPVPFPYRLSYDTTRVRSELGWRSRPVDQGLRETLALDPRPWRR